MRVAAAVFFVLLAFPREAAPHRLDDYLQATRLAVARDRITIELDLRPGAVIASAIFPLIDRDTDGAVTASEVERYARGVLSDLTLDVDGVSHRLTLTRAESASWAEFRDGLGTIRIEASAGVRLTDGTHRIRYENRHRPDIGVYLANALAPSTPEIAILRQQRDVHQRQFDVDINVTARSTSLSWALGQVILAAALLACRVREWAPRH
jgi:hypothetical protein